MELKDKILKEVEKALEDRVATIQLKYAAVRGSQYPLASLLREYEGKFAIDAGEVEAKKIAYEIRKMLAFADLKVSEEAAYFLYRVIVAYHEKGADGMTMKGILKYQEIAKNYFN